MCVTFGFFSFEFSIPYLSDVKNEKKSDLTQRGPPFNTDFQQGR